MKKGVWLVYTDCSDASREDEFNRWYSHTHLPDLAAAKGLVRVRRFRTLRPPHEPSRYLALYEFESDDLEDSVTDLSRIALDLFPQGRHIDCFEIAGLQLYEEIDSSSLEPLETVDYPRELPSHGDARSERTRA